MLQIIRENSKINLSTQQSELVYAVRVSKRAKYMRLTVSLEKGLIVVVPKTMNKRQSTHLVPEFVRQKQDWILETLKKLQEKSLHCPMASCQLPEQIHLPVIGQIFRVTYEAIESTQNKLTLFHRDDFLLHIKGDIRQKKSVAALFEAFFKDYARSYLSAKLEHLASASGLNYRRLTIRAQKTRWGSCSVQKNINLNYRLLFLDTALVDYVLLHELVHTLHMNHSKAFWQSLENLMPDARILDKQLNQSGKSLPCWIYYNQ